MLKHHELVKVKFDAFKEQKKQLAPQLAEKSRSHLVTRVGNVVVLYRPNPIEEKQPESVPTSATRITASPHSGFGCPRLDTRVSQGRRRVFSEHPLRSAALFGIPFHPERARRTPLRLWEDLAREVRYAPEYP